MARAQCPTGALQRDRLFTERLRADVVTLDLSAMRVDPSVGAPELEDRVAFALGLI